MTSYIQLIAVAVVVIGLGALGWLVKGKFDRAAEADRLEIELADVNAKWKAQIEKTAAADSDRLAVSNELAKTRQQLEEESHEVTRNIVRTIRDERVCDIGIESLRLLNTARGYRAVIVPPAATGAAKPSEAP